jgi:hypothetical protein
MQSNNGFERLALLDEFHTARINCAHEFSPRELAPAAARS